ncbi:MAG: ROK family protein [Ruminococcaceae bacterium]|nr:ROK family protein [Oscillospiraceae bacterium]
MYNIGIDLGGTNIAAGLVDENYNIIRKTSVETKASRPADEITKDMAKVCKQLCDEQGISISDVKSVGIATPGMADCDHGVVIYANNLPFLNYPIADKLKEFFPVETVLIANDANAAAYGEAVAGAGKGYKDFVMLTLGTGVGGGIIIDGKLYTGFNYAAGELGHIVIVHDGVQCSCGRKGCWEAYSSATALIRMTKEKMNECKDTAMWDYVGGDLDKVNGRTAFDCMRKGDKAAKEVVDVYMAYLATGTANIINIFQPSVVCFGGGVANEKENLLAPLREMVGKEVYSRSSDTTTQIRSAVLGNDAGIVGAAALIDM